MGRYYRKEDIQIDFEHEIRFGYDQCDVDFPCVFQTVTFALLPVKGLINRVWVDGITYTDEDRSEFEYYVGLNKCTNTHLDTVIEVCALGMPVFYIRLDEKEQKRIYKLLDKQCREKLGYSCEELLKQAEKRMKGDEEMEDRCVICGADISDLGRQVCKACEEKEIRSKKKQKTVFERLIFSRSRDEKEEKNR